jgi:hypothetical protein
MTALLSAKHCLSLYHPTEGVTFISQRRWGAEDILECVRQAVFRATPLLRDQEKRCRVRQLPDHRTKEISPSYFVSVFFRVFRGQKNQIDHSTRNPLDNRMKGHIY